MNYFRITFLGGAVQLWETEKSGADIAAQWPEASVVAITAEDFGTAITPTGSEVFSGD